MKHNQKYLIVFLFISLPLFVWSYYFFVYKPKFFVLNFYKNPNINYLTNLNVQVVKSSRYFEFKKNLNVKLLSVSPKKVRVLATYQAPNYLESTNALVGDIFFFENRWDHWELKSIETTHVNILGDLNTAKKELEVIVRSKNFVGLTVKSEKELISRNSEIFDSVILPEEEYKNTKDKKYSFKLTDKIEVLGGQHKIDIEIPIYAAWADDNKTLIYIEEKRRELNKLYLLNSFNVDTGEKKELISHDSLIGFITKNNFIAYSTSTSIGVINFKTDENKVLHSFEKVELHSDEMYIPNLQIEDEEVFSAEIYDKDYENNNLISKWEFAWDGAFAELIEKG